MKAVFKLLLCLCLFTILPLAVSAQSFTGQTVDLGDNLSIIVPEDWQITENEAGFFTMEGNAITNRPLTVEVMTPRYLRSLGINFTANLNVSEVLSSLTVLFDGVDPASADMNKLLYDDRSAASIRLTDDPTTDKLNIALTLSDGSFGYVTVTIGNGQHVVVNRQITEILASFDTARAGAVTGASFGSTGAACTVSAEDADTAQLRVGPGTNRGVITFLPADTDVTATGRIELDDGGVWYQLDLDEAAPNGTPAAELWVFEDDVTLNGDCDNIGEISAPPIVRASQQTGASGTSTSTGNNETTSTSSTPAAGLLQPIAGEYTLTIDPVFNASCEGYENMPSSATEFYEGVMTYIYYVETVDANSFYFNSDLYTRYPGSNSYDGIFTYEDGSFSYARLDVLAPGQLHGEANHAYELDGFTCHATMMFNSTLN